MKAVDLIRAEQYRLQQTENTADSTGQLAGSFDDRVADALDELRVAMAITDAGKIRARLVVTGARIAQAIDILTEHSRT